VKLALAFLSFYDNRQILKKANCILYEAKNNISVLAKT